MTRRRGPDRGRSAPSPRARRRLAACALCLSAGLPATPRPAAAQGQSLFSPSDLVAGGIFVASLALIEPLEGFDASVSAGLEDVPGRDRFYRAGGRALGTFAVDLGLVGATALFGQLTDRPGVKRVGLRSLESLLAVTAATQLVKTGVGRARPNVAGGDPDRVEPFGFRSDFNSFPSGHASHVFALATTLTHELGDASPWVPFVAYPLATWTAVTRVRDGRHWPTDVVAGAALGIFTANVLWRRHGEGGADRARPGITFRLLAPAGGGIGLGITIPAG